LQAGHSGYRIASRGANGQFMSECLITFEIASDTLFSVLAVPASPELSAVLQELGGQPDEIALAKQDSSAQDCPCAFLFPLQRHDELLQALREKRGQLSSNLIVQPVPDAARHALLHDLEKEMLQAQAAAAASKPVKDTSDQFLEMLSQAPAGRGVDGAEAAAAAETAAADSAGSGDDSTAAAAGAPTKKKYKPILAGKHPTKKKRDDAASIRVDDAARDQFRLTGEEEHVFNPQKLVRFIRVALMPFQMEGVRFLISKHGRGLLADEMGQHEAGATVTRARGIGVSVRLNDYGVVCFCSWHLQDWAKRFKLSAWQPTTSKASEHLAAAACCGHARRCGLTDFLWFAVTDWPLLVICPSSLRLNWQDEVCKVSLHIDGWLSGKSVACVLC